jgi:hypothetical protein
LLCATRRPAAGSSLTKSRVVLERLPVQVYNREMGREPRKPLLAEMLNDNQFTRKVERRILARMNALRDMGNLGPHGEPVEPADAARVLDDLCEVLDWYLRRYAGAVPGLAAHLMQDAGALGDPGSPPAGQSEEDAILSELHRKVLTAESAWELRRVLYELEAYLVQRPHSVEGRLLKDRIQAAIKRAERAECRGAPEVAMSGPDWRYLGGGHDKSSWVWWFLALVVAGWLLVLFFLLR